MLNHLNPKGKNVGGDLKKMSEEKKLSGQYKGFVNRKSYGHKQAGKAVVEIDPFELDKVVKQYKKLKKYQKSNLYQAAKLAGQKTTIDKLLDEYGSTEET